MNEYWDHQTTPTDGHLSPDIALLLYSLRRVRTKWREIARHSPDSVARAYRDAQLDVEMVIDEMPSRRRAFEALRDEIAGAVVTALRESET